MTGPDADEVWSMPTRLFEALESHARTERPRECCGVLIGVPGRLIEARPAANLSPDPNRYELDPGAHVAAIRETRGSGREVVGFYHSHPHSAPVPSARDLAESTYPEMVHVIVGFVRDGNRGNEDERAEIRAYRLLGDRFREVRLELIPQAP